MSNTTTRARGWKLTRRDGAVLAFTDCDIDLEVLGVTYLASSALTPSEAVSTLGLSVDDQEVQGGISSSAISESDLAAGLYDGATVEVVEIDWNNLTIHAVIGSYYLGEISRTQSAFAAELRSEAGLLAQKRGRYCIHSCDAELGDSRCGADISGLSGAGVISHVSGDSDFLVSGLGGFTSNNFAGGVIVWTAGNNLGQTQEVSAQNDDVLNLWRPPMFEVQVGDTFDAFPGCDKSFNTCKARFLNGDNFRGFPSTVGEAALTYAVPGEDGLDGG